LRHDIIVIIIIVVVIIIILLFLLYFYYYYYYNAFRVKGILNKRCGPDLQDRQTPV